MNIKTNFKLVEFSEELDLAEFYAEAGRRGFNNNSSQQVMVDCFRNEPEWKVWLLYQGDKVVGSVAAHSFDIMGKNCYRVLARTCVFAETRPSSGLLTANKWVVENQSCVNQFLLPVCVNWTKGDLYATSNESVVASQRLVNKHYFTTLTKAGISERIGVMNYRNTDQTIWRIDRDKFLANLDRYPRWDLSEN